jgi:biotin operon repressor
MGLSPEIKQQIFTLGQQRLSDRAIAKQLGVSRDAVVKYRNSAPVELGTPVVSVAEPELYEAIRKALRKESVQQHTLADKLDISPRRLQQAVEEMQAKGAMIEFRKLDGHYYITPSFAAPAGKTEITSAPVGEWSHRFGVTTDNHLCNKHARLDVLNAAYDEFERQGISTVYNAGNWVDGEARFNRTELIVRPGMDSQLDYMIDQWPVKKGITTHYVAGSDHEGWWQEREGVEVGRYLQYRAEEQGRHDLKYLGYAEADVALKHGNGEAIMRVVHPGGGSSYAISYTDQKRVETYSGGEKPHLELAGHYHKYNVSYPRQVHTVQCGCTCDQSLFMRKKRLSAHVGFVVIRIAQDSDGSIKRFQSEFFPYYDRAFYEKRF